MGTLTRAAKNGANALSRRFHLNVQAWSIFDSLWFMNAYDFTFEGKIYPLFVHQHNCGWPPGRMTERCAELALADGWLSEPANRDAIEIGAVTPYYWPRRVGTIIDPGDDHPQITDRSSVLDIDLTGKTVLAISTFEHIGNGEYGLAAKPEEIFTAFEKLFREATAFLVTVPMGYNATLDKYLVYLTNREVISRLSKVMGVEAPTTMPDLPEDVTLKFLVRSPEGGNDWREADKPEEGSSHYGKPGENYSQRAWANTVAVFQRRGK